MERAVFGTRSGEILMGYGPFESRAEPPRAGVAFYKNNFALSVEEPWLVPDRLEVWDGEGLGDLGKLEVEWTDPNPDQFAEVFREVTDAIRQGVIEKSVPVVTARGQGRGEPVSLLRAFRSLPRALRPYGWWDEGGGFIGATPEVLFRVFDGRVWTMALAGTARVEEEVLFAVDEKEIREHEFVAQTLIAKLSDLGMVVRQPREILDLGRLIHFQTLIKVELYQHQEVNRLIRRLHPTPALGPLPRTEATMSVLQEWRDRLGCPEAFGAPFGFWREGEFEGLVAIRMVAWEGDEMFLPSGCGVIEESRLVNEWRELKLKRDSVKSLFFPES